MILAQQTLSPGDMIRLFVWPDTTIAGRFLVQEDGSCYLPILGKVQVQGKTGAQLQQELTKAYGQFYQQPQITVEPMYRVYVTGEVKMPKDYYITGSESIMEVIAIAGGPSYNGDLGRVQLIKKKSAQKIDLSKAIKNGLSAAEVGLESGDVIYVPKSMLARWRDWSIFISLISTAISVYVLLFR